jgi:hypothetical protein
MSALYDKSAPYFYFSITGDVKIIAPTFVYGEAPATPGASLMSSSGAIMSGAFTMGVATVIVPQNGDDRWLLPKNEGNIFIMDTMNGSPQPRCIRRINYRTAGRFSRGTIITLMLNEPGTSVIDNACIELKNKELFESTKHSSLTLLATGGPTWIEVSRNV